MTKFRRIQKDYEIIEAMRFHAAAPPLNGKEIIAWATNGDKPEFLKRTQYVVFDDDSGLKLRVFGFELGYVIAEDGDWIVKRSPYDFGVLSDASFRAAYEPLNIANHMDTNEQKPRERLAGYDPPGWYEIELPAVTFVRWWNGECWHYEPGNPAAIQYEDARNITGPLTYSPALTSQLAEARQDLEKVNELARSLGYGQGELDDDLTGCLAKSIDGQRQEVKRLKAENAAYLKQWNDIDVRNERKHREWHSQLTAAQAAQKSAEERAEEYRVHLQAKTERARLLRERAEAAEKQRDQLQAEVEKLRSQVVHGPAELGEGEWVVVTWLDVSREWRPGWVIASHSALRSIFANQIAIRLPDEKAKGDA